MANLADLEDENPNIQQQAAEWRQARRENGEDPHDWAAFREHAQAIGAPDPGEEEPEDLRQD